MTRSMRMMKATGCLVLMGTLFGCSQDPEPLATSMGRGPAPFDPGQAYQPKVAPTDLRIPVTNTFFPAPVGAHWTYEMTSDEGVERTENTVLAETRVVWGVNATAVRDTV